MRTVLRIPLLVVLFCGGLAAQSDPAALAEQGRQALEAGRFDDAAGVYGRLVEMIPGNPGLLLNQGMALALAGRDAEAIPPLEQALAIETEIFPAWLFLGGSQLRLGRPERAVAPLREAVRLNAEDPQARQMLGEALSNLGRHREALQQWKALASATPEDPDVWGVMVQSYQALASEAFGALEKAAPESAFMIRLIADARLAQRQYPSALHLYRLALERDPEMRGLHASIAQLYRETDHADWAADEDRLEAALGPPSCEATPAECDFLAGKLDAAAGAKGEDPAALFWRAKAYAAMADRAFGKLNALPSSGRKHELAATLLADQQRFAEAANEWKQALAQEPRNPSYEAGYATQLYLARDSEAALPLIETLRARSPSDPQWNFFLGDLKLQALDAEGAVPLLEDAVAADASLLPAHHALGRAYMALQQPAKAIPHLQAALEIDQDGSLHYQLAQALIGLGRRDDAREPLEISRRMQEESRAVQEAAQQMEITGPTAP